MAAAPSVFLVRALEKILNDRDTRKSQHAQLKQVCVKALNDIKQKSKQDGDEKDGSEGRSITAGGADAYFEPFELACKSKTPGIVSTALDGLQKLIAPGHLTGGSADPDDPRKHLVDRMVTTVCSCFHGQNTDEGIQLQIIKAVLTMVSAPTCEVHGSSLLQVVLCCFNIYLASKNQINQTTAKATLTQMLSIIFQRMEQQGEKEKVPETTLSVPVTTAARTTATPEGDVDSIDDTASNASENLETGEDVVVPMENDTGADNGTVDEAAPSPAADDEEEVPQEQGDGEGSEVTSLNNETLSDGDGVDGLDFKQNKKLKFQTVEQKDAFLVFRSLCRLSMKGVDSTDPKSPELSSIVLSLELLLSVLQNSGPVFRTSDLFIRAIKQYLCVALSKNGVSHVSQVFEVSLSIFLTLLQSFKYHLKMQIEVFFKEIFLSILQSTSSSYHHKWLVMQALGRICGDAQCIVDIYLNYDCDLSLANIYEQLVRDIAHVAQGHKAVVLGSPTPAQEKALQMKGIECFVSILRCMVEWSRELYVHPGASQTAGTSQESHSHRGSIDNLPVLAREGSSPSPLHPRPPSAATDQADSSTSTTAEGSNNMDNPEMVEVRKKRKDMMEQGLLKFVQHPKKGVKFLQEQSLVGPEPTDVAKFFHSDDRLDMAAIGEYIGDTPKFCIDVMYAYCDQMDFVGLEFVPALRLFLSGFRLPGESQKIDRLMEKFAARYCETNQSTQVFASADAAYVLAYSVIILATDLHSTKIKREKKMTKEEYIKMNRGINDQKDLPREYLEGVYDEIARQEITLRAGGNKGLRLQAAPNEKARRQQYSMEMHDMEKTAKALMEDRSRMQTSFTSATHIEHVRPMFKMAWTSFLAALSLSLRDADDMEMVTLCLDGFRCSIRVASIFNMQLERNAFVQSLAKFTLLTNMGLSEMKPKNIETIKTLIAVAHSEGNYLQESWHEILNVVSQLELAQLIGTGVKTQYISSGANDSGAGGSGIRDSSAAANEFLEGARGKMDQKTLASIQESMGETSSQSVVVAVDRIFTSSSLLDGDAIVDFVRALCTVSVAELENKVAPRTFCLTKIVEISYYNMGRIRLEWSRIWAVLGDYFNKVGCIEKEEIAFFAVDSLRQLSIKFLEKGELANFRFQKDFLKPFEYVMRKTTSSLIRDMIVSCTEQMVSKQVHNIKSGWVNIFAVFHVAAADAGQRVVEQAFICTSMIFGQHFAATIDTFQDAIKCLSEFACNPGYPDTSMEAIRLIDYCGKQLAEKPELFRDLTTEEAVSVDDRIWMKGWLPVLVELSRIVRRCKLDVRTRALTVMFNIMKSFGDQFALHWWQDLFSILFRIFDNSELPESQKSEWMTTTCPHALMAIVDVFTQHFAELAPVLLDDLFGQFCWCAQQDNKDLAGASLDCVESFVLGNGDQFDEATWDKTVACIERVFDETLPRKLLTWSPQNTALQNSVEVVADKAKEDPAKENEKEKEQEQEPVKENKDKEKEKTAPGTPQARRDTTGGTPKAGRDVDDGLRRLFNQLTVRCQVQRGLIRTIDHILFSAISSKEEDSRLYQAVSTEATQRQAGTPQQSPAIQSHERPRQHAEVRRVPSSAGAMISCISLQQLLKLVDILLRSHEFAKSFNQNEELRQQLWKAGFMGRLKPNMWSQEVASIACALRLLFLIYDSERFSDQWDAVESQVMSVWHQAVAYYCTLASDKHRREWMSVLLLLFNHLMNLSPERFDRHLLSEEAMLIYDILPLDTEAEIRCTVRNLLREMHLRNCALR